MDAQEQKTAVAALSVASNSALVAGKVVVGIATGSVSVISEAAHSAVDLLAAVIALFAVRKSGEPADREHPFGHGKVENISGTIEALLIFLAAGWIVYEAVRKIMRPAPIENTGWAVGVMLASSLVNLGVSHLLFRTGKRTDSLALQADAWHLRTDVYTSVGVMGGLALIWLGGRLAPGVPLGWLDPVAAMAVAALIVKAAWDLTRQSARDLLDTSLPAEEQAIVRNIITAHAPVARAYHRLKTRKSGADRFIEFHLLVAADMTVQDSHELTRVMEHEMHGKLARATVTIHVEPCHAACTPDCLRDCVLDDDKRRRVSERPGSGGSPEPPSEEG
jgi:cation diffusion facilitator family transporter